MKWEVRRTKINRYDQGDVPPKYKAEIEISTSDANEAITITTLSDLFKKAMADFNVDANASISGPVSLTFKWE
jgi:hypothetical protein